MSHHVEENACITLSQGQWRDILRLARLGEQEVLERLDDEEAVGDMPLGMEEMLAKAVESEACENLEDGLSGTAPAMRVRVYDIILDNPAGDGFSATFDLDEEMTGEELEDYINNRVAEETGFCHTSGFNIEVII